VSSQIRDHLNEYLARAGGQSEPQHGGFNALTPTSARWPKFNALMDDIERSLGEEEKKFIIHKRDHEQMSG